MNLFLYTLHKGERLSKELVSCLANLFDEFTVCVGQLIALAVNQNVPINLLIGTARLLEKVIFFKQACLNTLRQMNKLGFCVIGLDMGNI